MDVRFKFLCDGKHAVGLASLYHVQVLLIKMGVEIEVRCCVIVGKFLSC